MANNRVYYAIQQVNMGSTAGGSTVARGVQSVGITTNFMVITRQNDLSAAKLRVVNAITDYNKSINSLRKAVGIILEEKNIKVISQNP